MPAMGATVHHHGVLENPNPVEPVHKIGFFEKLKKKLHLGHGEETVVDPATGTTVGVTPTRDLASEVRSDKELKKLEKERQKELHKLEK
jgi:hypothetical protein